MEAVPRLPMLNFDLKTSPEPTPFGPKLKQYIRDFYHEDPEMYSNEIHTLESLRAAAVCAVRDVTGCSTLKRYYCQLHFLQSRFPMSKDGAAAVPFTWRDTYASMVCTLADIRFELVAILYNVGALHSQLGASDSRVTADGMKMSCTHFQCAAWAFQHLKDTFPQPAGVDLAPDVMQFMYHLTLAQAQECILEKSMMDNRKATIIAKVAVQIVDYYNLALNTLEQGGSEDCSVSETVGSKIYKNWKRYVKFKIAYHTCVSLLYQGQQAEEQQKMGERVAYYHAAADKLEEAVKLSKGMDNAEMVNEALTFTHDVVEGKKKAAKNENEFIYHEEVPDRDVLPDIKGASLVKGIPFNVNDPEVSGPDIFARLVPMKAHEASSLYSEEKAKLLRKVGVMIDEKDEELVSFMTSLQLEHLNLHSEPNTLPQELVDRCAALSAKPNAIQNLIDSMNKLADTYQDVEEMLQEIKEFLQMEEAKEKEYQEVMGKRPPSIVATDLTREANKYQEAHAKASESNQTLHKAMTLHVSNLRILSQPLAELQRQIPTVSSLDSPEDESAVKEMQHLVGKVEEMKRQRAMLATQLRESICQDDITRQLVTRTTEALDNVFDQEMQKHQHYVSVIEQNLAAQENILKALTDAYARYAGTRKATNEILRKREATISALISSYDAYEDLLAKSSKGLEFYRKLETNVSKLLQRVKSTCKVQEEERDQILAKNNKRLPAEKIPETDRLPTDIGAPSSGGPKLKDYLHSMKRGAAAVGGYGGTADTRASGSYYATGVGGAGYGRAPVPSPQPSYYDQTTTSSSSAQWIPTVRPAPVGSEGTGEQSSSLCSSNTVKQDLEESKSNFSKASTGYIQPTSSGYIPSPVVSSSQYPTNTPPYYSSTYDTITYNAPSYPSAQTYPHGYASNTSYGYGAQYQAQYTDAVNSQADKPYHPTPSPGPSGQPANQYMAKSTTFPQQTAQTGYQHYSTLQSYQQPGYSSQPPGSVQTYGTSYEPATSYAGTSFPSSQSAYSASSSSQVPFSSSSSQIYSALPNQGTAFPVTSQQAVVPTQSNTYAQVHSYMGQTNYGYSATNGTYQYNTGYPTSQSTNYGTQQPYAAQNSWQQQPGISGTSGTGGTAGSTTAPYYGGEFHSKPVNSSTSLSSGSSSEVSLPSQQPYYSSGSAVAPGEYQYMQGAGASCYTNAGKYATSQTCSSQTSVEGQTYAAQYNASQAISGYQTPAYGQGCYYSVPYGYQYPDGTTGSDSPSPQHVAQQPQQEAQQPEQQQNSSTYMQARDHNQQGTITTNCHGSSSRSSSSMGNGVEQDASSNVDLLAGLDFSLNHAPLTPLQASKQGPQAQSLVNQKSISSPGSVPPKQGAQGSAPSLQRPQKPAQIISADIETKPEVQTNGAGPVEPKTEVAEHETVSKLEIPESCDGQLESKQAQKLFGKDPYTDPEALNQFVQEVEKYAKFVVGLTTKTLNGPTPLDMKWKELLDLQEKDTHKRSISVARCYPMKNMFPDILPYDNSRVELPSTKDDYINASYMKELTPLTPPFIMTQVPLPSTYTDFWTMVCEQQVEVVVCLLSDLELMGQIYWPVDKAQELAMGKMKLTLQSSNVRQHWIERILSISIADTRFTRVVIHLQFVAWPGSSFPASPGPFLSFVSEALNFYGQQRVGSHPVVVHCLSGVGRTGLFCLVAAALLEIQAGRGLLDLVGATADMSSCRKGSLRDREHLKFAYQAVLYFAQDLLMKRATSSSNLHCDELEVPASRCGYSSSRSSSGRSSPLIFSLKPDASTTKQRKRYTREHFEAKASDSSLEVPTIASGDPLSQLDPLWPLKRL